MNITEYDSPYCDHGILKTECKKPHKPKKQTQPQYRGKSEWAKENGLPIRLNESNL